jgi:hypothetical protein
MEKQTLNAQANRLLDTGQYFLALDLLLPALEEVVDDPSLQQLTARAVIRVGAKQRAERLLKWSSMATNRSSRPAPSTESRRLPMMR